MKTLFFALLFSTPAFADMDHSFLKGPFFSGQEVTKACIQCHDKEAQQVIRSPHYLWKGAPKIIQSSSATLMDLGKINLMNNFCISPAGGSMFMCSRCHVGYGFTQNVGPDTQDHSKVDCLVCHANAGNYKKWNGGEPDPALIATGVINLSAAAQSVGEPTRANCGSCHFYGGGADGVKHGDLDSSLVAPTASLDVHMGKKKFSCQKCHKSEDHKISGASMFLATHDGRTSCTDCHGGKPHDSSRLNAHVSKVACQTCHIPTFAKVIPTKMSWDWSTAGQDVDPVPLQFGREAYNKMKGSFTWGLNVVPDYAWHNGKMKRYITGDKITTLEVAINEPVGAKGDGISKIFPFKIHRGKQPMDSNYRHLLIPQTAGGYWSHFDWTKALTDGAKASGLPFSGQFEFIETKYYSAINHMVAPKSNALKCDQCHGPTGRMNWKALGYAGDPRTK